MKFKALFCDRGNNDTSLRFFVIYNILIKKKIISSVISSFNQYRWQNNFYKTIGFKVFYYFNSKTSFNHPIEIIKSFFFIFLIILNNKIYLREYLSNTLIDNKNFGYLIYDEYLKQTNNYKEKKLNFNFIRVLYMSILKIQILKKIVLRKNYNLFFITQQNYINPSTIIRALYNDDKNKKIIYVNRGGFQLIDSKTFLTNSYKRIDKKIIYSRKFNSEFEKKSKIFFKKRFSGKIDYRNDLPLAFKSNKKIKLKKIKNFRILLACHRLSDANHTYPKNIFLNYFDYIEETLKVLVNTQHEIFIRMHPASSKFEKDLILKLIDKFNSNKIKIISTKVNTQNVIKQMDFLITLHGTIGIEFPVIRKLKSIICADSSYANFKFCKRIKDLKELNDFLKNDLKPIKLTNKEFKEAKKYLYYSDQFDMKRKFAVYYSERLKKNYTPKYFPSDRSLPDKEFFNNINSNSFFKNYKKDEYFKEVEFRLNKLLSNKRYNFKNDHNL